MAGVIEADAVGSDHLRMAFDLDRLGAGHVGAIATEPEEGGQRGGGLGAEDTHGDTARSIALAHFDPDDFGIGRRR